MELSSFNAKSMCRYGLLDLRRLNNVIEVRFVFLAVAKKEKIGSYNSTYLFRANSEFAVPFEGIESMYLLVCLSSPRNRTYFPCHNSV